MFQLAGQDRKVLVKALAQRHENVDELAMFLDLELDQDLHAWCAAGGLEQVAWRVVKRATSRGWLVQLLHTAAKAWPDEPDVARLARSVPAGAAVIAVPAADASSYDMRDHVEEFGIARHNSQHNLVGVAVPGVEEPFLWHLHERLAAAAGAARIGGYALGIYDSPATLLQKLGQYERRLQREALLVPVQAIGLPDAAEQIAQVWAGLADSAAWRHELVVVFAVDPAVLAQLPAGVHRLPTAPAVQVKHVIAFVDRLYRDIPGWPPTRSRQFADAIYDRATQAEERAQLHALYVAIEEHLHDMRQDWPRFLAGQDAS